MKFYPYQQEMLRQIAASMGMSYEELTADWEPSMAKVIEINPEDRYKPPRGPDITIWHDPDPDTYTVKLRPRGLDSGILYGENGRPADIGPTRDGPAQWSRVSEALDHFRAVQVNLDKLALGEPIVSRQRRD